MTDAKKTAGGRATEAGMAFQAAVSTWFATQLLADVPIGAQFGLPDARRVVGLRCETADALDDVVVQLDDGSAIYTQCKTHPALMKAPDSSLGKALGQLVALFVKEKRVALAAKSDAALLAVAEDAPRSLDHLEAGCRLFDHGGIWHEVIAQASEDVRGALDVFAEHVRSAWKNGGVAAITDDDLVAMARLFRIRRFAEDATSARWRETSHLLGRRVFGSDGAGDPPMATLLALSRTLIGTGAPADRAGLLRALRAAGHVDVSAPAFEKDIAALRAHSAAELNRLRQHAILPFGEGLRIERECLEPLREAAAGGSLLVTGEPGAGKTGVLVALAERLTQGRGPVLFLSVEQFSGLTLRSQLRAELRLEHDPVDVLAAWPGPETGVLIIDALDASRGGPAESVVAGLIANASERLGPRWSIVASIRSFDLRNGQRFRELMRGPPPNPLFGEPGLADVRHFSVPALSPGEFAAISTASKSFVELEAGAPAKLRALLRNVFNLSLVADLLGAGHAASSFRTVATQSELIRRYEDVRLPNQQLKLAAKAAVTLMVQRRQLAVRATDIENDAVDEVRAAGVLVSAGGDRVAFAHHVLFDHLAGRVFLTCDDTKAMQRQLAGDPSIGLLLGPALRFALEQVWQDDRGGRPTTWRFLTDLAGAETLGPVVMSIAVRTAAEQVEGPPDVDGLCKLVEARTDPVALARVLPQLARFVGMVLAERRDLPTQVALAWAEVASTTAASANPQLADTARFLLSTLADRADFTNAAVEAAFGVAARRFLATCWSALPDYPVLVTDAIRFTARSYRSDPAAAKALLRRILEDRFEAHAAEEAPCLADGIRHIFPHDQAFAIQIFSTIFGRDVTDDAKTWVGGSASRILPLTSTRRQDYGHARWTLNEALRALLDEAPTTGTAAVVAAVAGLDAGQLREQGRRAEPTDLLIGGERTQVVDDRHSLHDWREVDDFEEKPLATFVDFLRSCPPEAFGVAVATARALPSNASVWARLLGVAAERADAPRLLLWPFASDPHLASLRGLARDAVVFLAESYGAVGAEDRAFFERRSLAQGLFPAGRESDWWRSVLCRWLSIVPPELLATQEMQLFRTAMDAAGGLTGNPPFSSTMTRWESIEDGVDDSLLGDIGGQVPSPGRELRAASRRVEEDLKPVSEGDWPATLAGLWAHIVELVRELDRVPTEPLPPQLVRSSWGVVANGVEHLAESSAYVPAADGLPELSTLLALIDRLSKSPFPESAEPASGHLAWGSWDVRVYAASSLVALAARFADERPDIADRMQACLLDPIPTVRLQVAQDLAVLRNGADDRMWQMVEQLASAECHPDILASFITHSLSTISRAHPERCATLLSRLSVRAQADASVEPCMLEAAKLVARLCVVHDQPVAWELVSAWSASLPRNGAHLASMLHDLREALFLPYGAAPTPDGLELAGRGRRLVELFVVTAVTSLGRSRTHLLGTPDETTVAKWRPEHSAADELLGQVCNALFFGSGAWTSTGAAKDGSGLADADAKRRFLADYATVLDAVEAHPRSESVHKLVALLALLLDADPGSIFDRITKLLLGPGRADGYQFESLAVTKSVMLIRRYLADHRDLFDDADRRQNLIAVLELFSSAGWPEALRLLFELPDLMR